MADNNFQSIKNPKEFEPIKAPESDVDSHSRPGNENVHFGSEKVVSQSIRKALGINKINLQDTDLSIESDSSNNNQNDAIEEDSNNSNFNIFNTELISDNLDPVITFSPNESLFEGSEQTQNNNSSENTPIDSAQALEADLSTTEQAIENTEETIEEEILTEDEATEEENEEETISEEDNETIEEVTVVPTITNSPPQANADIASTTEDGSITINVLANDTDPDLNIVNRNESLSITSASVVALIMALLQSAEVN